MGIVVLFGLDVVVKNKYEDVVGDWTIIGGFPWVFNRVVGVV